MSLIIRICVATLTVISIPSMHAQDRYAVVKDPQSPPDISYTRYFTRDRFDRRITFYISGDQNRQLPIVVSVLGSGAYSNFVRRGEKILEAHRADREVFAGSAHLLVVEKPGVNFLDEHPPSEGAIHASAEFRREHTLERWSEAVSAAVRAARTLPLADNSKCLLIGHSEGGIVVARVAANNSFVTHVASLAGGGPTQLFGFLESARDGRLYKSLPPDPEKQAAQLLADVRAIQADPDSSEKLWFGHPYRRWSTFWSTSTLEQLLQTKAKVYVVQGTADSNASSVASDLLYATFLASGRNVTYWRIAGADHGFEPAGQPGMKGWRTVFQEVQRWFFE